MKKKVVAIALVACLAVIAIAGASLAYFTDEDSAVNVMTVGSVAIEQNEQQRGSEGDLEEFVQNKDLSPAVDLRGADNDTTDDAFTVLDEKVGAKVFNPDIKNVIDKFVNVKNTGTKDAYIRTIIAFETVIQYEENTTNEINLHDVYFLVNGTYDYLYNEDGTAMVIEIDGTQYWLAVCTYEDAVAPEATTDYSLRQIALTWDADNEVSPLFGDSYDILCLSQGVQTTGFESVGADYALNTAFGAITETSAQAWFEAIVK